MEQNDRICTFLPLRLSAYLPISGRVPEDLSAGMRSPLLQQGCHIVSPRAYFGFLKEHNGRCISMPSSFSSATPSAIDRGDLYR